MVKIIYVICFFAAAFFAYRFNIWLGIAVSIAALIYGITVFLPAWWSLQAQRAFGEGDFKKAEKLFKKSIDTGKESMSVRISYAYVLMRTGKFDEAEKILDVIIRTKNPKFEKDRRTAKQQRCMVYYKQGRLDEALEDAMEMFNGGYKNTQLYGMIGYFKLIGGDNLADATKFCEEAYDYNSDDRDITDNLSLCYYENGYYEKAEELSDKIIKEAPKFVEAYYHGAQIAMKRGKYKKAQELMSHLDDCRWSEMTTVSHEETEELNKQIERKLRSGIKYE